MVKRGILHAYLFSLISYLKNPYLCSRSNRAMIYTGAQIENFRGIRLCKLDQLGRVNIFFGKNNCGKTSLLEALFLLSGQSNPALPITINNVRALRVAGKEDLQNLFYGADVRNSISLSASGARQRSATIRMIALHNELLSADQLEGADSASVLKYGLDYKYSALSGGDKVYHSRLSMTADGKRFQSQTDNAYSEDFIAAYIAPGTLLSTARGDLEEVMKNKQEGEIIELLQVVEPRLKDIQVVGEKIMVDIGLPTRLPVNLLGDGVRKVLSIILSIYKRRNGVILIDEIENGLHHSVMGKLWEAILHTSRETNTQLFITTHSIDILKSLANVIRAEEGENPDVAAYKLVRKTDDELAALRYAPAQFAYLIEQNTEVR